MPSRTSPAGPPRGSPGLECEVGRAGARIVPVADNYDRLRYAAEAITSDARYTRSVTRARCCAARPARSCRRAAAARGRAQRDVLLVCPGIVYRRDVIDGCTPASRTRWTCGGSCGGRARR